MVLDADELLEADAVGRAGHERPVVREGIAAVDVDVAVVQHTGRLRVVLQEDVHGVHLLEVPADAALGAEHLEGVLALRTDHRAAGLEGAARAVFEGAHHPDVVLVGDLAGRVAGLAAVVVSSLTGGERALLDVGLARPHDLGDPARRATDQVVSEVDAVREDVGAHAVAGLVDEEAPREQAHRVAGVGAEEAALVVHDRAEVSAVDERLGVLHERRPAVVVPDSGDDTGTASSPLGGHGLGRSTAHGLLAEHVLAVRCRCLDDLDVEHVRCRDEDDVDVGVADHLVPVGHGLTEAEVVDSGGAARFEDVAHHHHVGLVLALGEVGGGTTAAAAVRLAHPAEADDADSETTGHGVLSCCSM